ncbi:MAG: CoA ester lyase [Kiritimatiellae bacterium]|jgi:malyl-CoA/(S)-citramalyl-CoA lyase|nr:CoA ester lyase [Kiritimatiellia bacterium]
MRPPRRSILSVPAHRASMHAKGAGSDADVIMLDLEDSCPPDEKIAARNTVIESIQSLDFSGKILTLRINDPAGPFALRDVLEVIPPIGAQLDTLVIPKVESASQIHFLDQLLTALEREMNLKTPIGLEPIIESARALRDASDIAAASSRVRTLVFGIADYSASINMPLGSISGHGENDGVYPGDPLHFVYSRLILCGKAEGLHVIDAPYGNFRDLDGLRIAAARSRALGFDGNWAIHPDQIAEINLAFSPSPEEIDRAQQVLAAYRDALAAGRGSASIGSSMIDNASVRMAEDVIARANACTS